MTRKDIQYIASVKRGLKGLKFPSIGLCPGCEECADNFDMSQDEFSAAWQSGDVSEEGNISYSGCGICNSELGGTHYVWHWVDNDGAINHESDACADCVQYLCNGDLPNED